jgi:serine/threonine protein kinase
MPFAIDDGPHSIAGSGATGLVRKAVSRTDGHLVAIKEIRTERRTTDRVLKEILLLKRCSHPNVLRLEKVMQVKPHWDTFYLVTSPWAPTTLHAFITASDSRLELFPWFRQTNLVSEIIAENYHTASSLASLMD